MIESDQSSAQKWGINVFLAMGLLCKIRTVCRLPSAAYSRILLLFFSLISIKLILLFEFRTYLYQFHWRTLTPAITWVNYVAFYSVIGIAILSIISLARYCRRSGLKSVRAANAAILALGATFILLNLHHGNFSWFFLLVTGGVKFKILLTELGSGIFLASPYIGIWSFGYIVIFLIMVRAGFEHNTLYLTSIVVAIFSCLNLRELLWYKDELLSIGVVGLITLWMMCQPERKLHVAWLLVPVAWILFRCALFYFTSSEHLTHYFGMLAAEAVILFGALTIVAKDYNFYVPWIKLTPFYFVGFLLLTSRNYPASVNINRLLCQSIELPNYFLGEFAIAMILAVSAVICYRIRPKGTFFWLDIISLGIIAVSLVDLRLSQIMGIRLDWDVLSFCNKPKIIWQMARPYLPVCFLAFGICAAIYALALRAIRRWQRSSGECADETRMGFGTVYALAIFLMTGVLGLSCVQQDKAQEQVITHLALTSPLWKRSSIRPLDRNQFLNTAKSLGLTGFERPHDRPVTISEKPLNVLLVFMESSYNQHLSLFDGTEETEPLLSKYKERMEIFPNYFSAFAGSIHARFASFTSLYPTTDFNAFTLQRVNVKSIFELLHERGYSCSMFYSSHFDYTGFRDFLTDRSLDVMCDADTMPGASAAGRVNWGVREELTLGAIRDQIKKYAMGNQRFFLTYVPAAPHYPYDGIPARFQKFKPGPKGDYTSAYLNELLYMDWVVASILDQLQESGLLDKTLVVITDDHGEMLGSNNGPIGHGWVVTPELTNIPLIILNPQRPGYHLNLSTGSQVDLLPTILDCLGIPLPADQLYEGNSLYNQTNNHDGLIYLNSYGQYAVIQDKHFLRGSRTSENEANESTVSSVYDISNQTNKTVFELSKSSVSARNIRIDRFDEFQKNLLFNYSVYCELLCGGKRVAAPSSGP